MDTTYESARLQISDPSNPIPAPENLSEAYREKIEQGRIELKRLLENPDEVVNLKDLKYEEELKKEMAVQNAKKEEEEAARLEAQRIRKEQEIRLKEEKEKARLARKEALELEKAEKVKEAKIKAEKAREAKLEAFRLQKEMANKQNTATASSNDSDGNDVGTIITAIGALGAIGFAVTMNEDDIEEMVSIVEQNSTLTSVEEFVEEFNTFNDTNLEPELEIKENSSIAANTTLLPEDSVETLSENTATEANNVTEFEDQKVIEKDLVLEDVEINGKPLLDINAKPSDLLQDMIVDKKNTSQADGGLYDNIVIEDDPEQRARDAMEDYLNTDDGGEEWLGVLAQMMEDDSDVETSNI